MGRLAGKRALVTGAASGIGEATARLFAGEGARVLMTDLNEERGQAICEEIRAAGGDALFFAGNLVDEALPKDLAALVESEFDGRLEVLANCGGILIQGPFLEQTDEDLDRLMKINFRGAIRMMRQFIPVMVAGGGGSIINVTSISAQWPEVNSYFYGAAKAALNVTSRNIAKEFAGSGVRVNCIQPGPVNTGMTPQEVKDDPVLMQGLLDHFCMLGRMGKPEDIAYGALYLASDESSWVTGTDLVIDGGACISN